MPRILLTLLLCLTLIAGAVGSVWSATAMAMPMAKPGSECGFGSKPHSDPGFAIADSAHDCCQHEKATTPCASGDHCDCQQHCNMLPSVTMTRLAPMRHALAPMPALPSRGDVAPGELNRPPIA
ncbi:hypothetical protein [Stenotrophomonas pigmentata]|uniref:hypothetical protein n=1 Tax=Stenotrophomonas pigmentata TaxID=3055080 RepID=UPI0026E9A749|nr:hypothetical protein [Stenotrophomonas sp. 610A2]